MALIIRQKIEDMVRIISAKETIDVIVKEWESQIERVRLEIRDQFGISSLHIRRSLGTYRLRDDIRLFVSPNSSKRGGGVPIGYIADRAKYTILRESLLYHQF